MIWKSKKPPQYIFYDDQWEREEDHKLFYAHQGYWYSLDYEKVEWAKKSIVMKFRESLTPVEL